MTLEKLKKEFNIEQLDTLPYETAVHILYASNVILDLLRQVLEPYDISYQQYNALKIIERAQKHTLTCSTLKELMIEKNSDITRLSVRLEEKGLISRKKDKLNKRNVNLVLKNKGLALVQEINEVVLKRTSETFHLSDEEAIKLNHLLAELVRRFKTNA